MNNEELAEAIAVMQAALRGERIQSRHRGGNPHNWNRLSQEAIKWDWAVFEYRVEPKPPVDWSKVPVDTKIHVSIGGVIYNRHFAKFSNCGHVRFFANGMTSFSCAGRLLDEVTDYMPAEECELAEQPIDGKD